MSELDRFRREVPGFERASDADVVREISSRTNRPFEEVAEVFQLPVRGLGSEMVRQLGAGFAVDTPQIIGGALQYFGSREEAPREPFGRRLTPQTGLERQMLGLPEPRESLAYRAGTALRAGAEARAPSWEPDVRGRGQTAQYALQGIRATAPVLTGLAPSILPGGQAITAAVLPTAFAGSAAQETYERLVEQGIPEERAAEAARRVLGLTLAGETLGTAAIMRTAKAVSPILRAPRTTGEVARRATDTRVLAPAAAAVAANIPAQIGTELIQELGQAEIERAYGGEGEDLVQLAKDTAAITGFMTLFLGPLSFGGARARARRSEELKQALYGEQVDPQVRAQAMDIVMAEAQRQNITPENIDAWFEQQLEIEDARTAALAAAEERAATEAVANRDQSLEDIVKQEGLTRGLTAQDLLSPGVTSAEIERELGVRRKPTDPKKYIKGFTQAFDEPSGQFVADPETGVERELTMGEYYQRQGGVLDLTEESPAKAAVARDAATQSLRDPRSLFLRDTLGIVPTQPALQLADAIEQSGIPLDSEVVAPIVTYAAQRPMSKKRLEKALEMLDAAIIEARRTPQQEVAPVVSSPAVSESVGGLPAAETPAAGLSQGVPVVTPEGEARGPQAPQAQQTEAQGQEAATPAPTLEQLLDTAELGDAERNRLEIARATGQEGLADAFESDAEGRRVDEDAATEAQVEETLAARFAKSKNPARDRQVLAAYITATRGTLQGVSKDVLEAIAKDFNMGVDNVQKIGNTESLVRAGQAVGLTRGQVLDAFNLRDRSKSKALPESQLTDWGVSEEGTVGTAVARAGLDPEAGFVDDASRFWEEESSSGNPAADALFREQNTVAEFTRIVGELEAQGAAEALATAKANLDAAKQRLNTLVSDSRKKVDGEKAKKGKAKSELSEQEAALRKKLVSEAEAKRRADRKGFEVGDTVVNPRLGTGVVQSFAGSGDATTATIRFLNGQTRELSIKAAKLEKTNAVQEQAATEVSVQPEAEAGQRVGRQVRSAQEPAAEGQVLTSQETYAQVVAGIPGAPTFDSLTAPQQKQVADLATKGQLNLAAVNRIVGDAPRQMTRGEPKANTEGREMADTMDTLARGMTRTGGVTDLNNVKVDITPTTAEALSQVNAVAEVFESYRQAGQANAINAVESWYVTSTPVTWDGVFAMVDGKPSVILNARVLMTLPEESAWTVRHEIGHAIDRVQIGGEFSSSPLFNVSVTQNRIIPRGQLMQDIVAFRENNPDSELAQHLKYPLDMEHTGRIDADVLRQEVFGQLWAFYSTSEANRNFMEDNLPFVFDYFDGVVNEEVKSPAFAGATASATQTAGEQQQAAAQAESVESGRIRSREQIQGVVRAHMRQPAERIKNLNRIPEQARGPARVVSTALEDIGGRVLDFAMFTHTLVDRAVKLGMTSAKNLQRTLAARDLMAREEERAVESILNGYTNLPQNERGRGEGSVNRFLFDSTRSGKWGYGDNVDSAMAKRFDALSPEGKRLVQDIFAHGDRMLQRKKDIVLKSTRSEFDAQIENAKTAAEKAELRKAKQLALKRFESLFKIREGRPYAPIKRNGNYVVIAMSKEYMAAKRDKDAKAMERLEADGDHYHVTFTDGKNAARSLQAQLNDQGAFADVQVAQRDTVTDELFSNESAMQQLTKLRSNVDARVKAGEAEAGKLLSMINQMYLEALAEGSARKSEMKRRGVDGEVDMISSFGIQGRADANFLASLQYSEQVTDVLNAMRAESKTGDRTRKSEVLNELTKRYSESLEVPNNPWLNKLLRLSSIHFLASSPAYYMQNLTQPFMMSVPAMAGTYNYGTVVSELYKAYTELGPVMKSAKLFSQQLDYSTVPADVKTAINELVNRGRIDIGLETELGEFQVEGEGRFAKGWNKVDKGLRMAVQKGEAVNRLSTAIAAYRLARNQGKLDVDAAVDYADRILLETHGDYGRFNAPRVFNTPVGRMALQFRKFQLIQLTWYSKMIKDAITDPKERATALKSLSFALAHTGVLAGAMGLPGYYAVAWALGALFGDQDEPFDLNDEIRKMIGDPDIANMVLRGVPVLGGADWSGKIGAGTMISIMPFSNADLTTRSGFYEALGTAVGGASAGMVVKGVDGLGLIANGDYMKGTELLLPKGLGDMLKAYRLGTDGATRRNNDVILPAGELSSLELAWQAVGIIPAQMSSMYERQQRVRDTEQRFRDRTARIKNDYTQAVRKGDNAAAAKARQEWQNLQSARAKAGLKRQPLSNLLKAPQEQRKRERDTAGGIQFSRSTRGMVESITER